MGYIGTNQHEVEVLPAATVTADLISAAAQDSQPVDDHPATGDLQPVAAEHGADHG